MNYSPRAKESWKMSDQDQVQPGHEGDDQPWREQRHQPEPEAIQGMHAGRRIPEEKQRHEADDTQVGAVSRVAGDTAGSSRGGQTESGLSSGSSFGDPGVQGHQGSSMTPGAGGRAHASGEGRSTEGAFAEEQPSRNANPLSDYRDAGIAKNELGPSGHDNRAPHADRTQGGDQ